ncbi:putative alpha-L-fucosidase [Paenibacillus agaridevorans]|uniref:Putative alpha-L-fucosidase n=1 Tax=Paenibacillus agaridevorans TaxID=171404 RepID=A0A2R5ESC1_9BACL|nr:putative alpha-L-fucosidase [Paenibacillus agaridevorans]
MIDKRMRAWSNNYTLNINAEMNYWPAETCNMAELHAPLIEFIGRLAINGKKTAEINTVRGGGLRTIIRICGDKRRR